MPTVVQLTPEQMKTIDEIAKSTGLTNWNLLVFDPDTQKYNSFSHLDDKNALYSCMCCLREMILTAVNWMRSDMNENQTHGRGNC